MDERKRCCFSGRRPQHLAWGSREDDPRCLALKRELAARLEGVYESGYRDFLCGMALGCDMYFAEAVLALRERHPDVRLEAVIPCGDQPERWPLRQRKRYNALLDSCNAVTVLQIRYTPDCMMRRNRYMVDHASLLLACHDGQPGGTMNTLRYAMERGLEIVLIELS